MRLALLTQVAAVAFLVSGCPGVPGSAPTGGGNCAPGQNCSGPGGAGGTGGVGGIGGEAGSGNGGSGNGGSGNGGAGTGGGSSGAGGADPAVCEMLKSDITVKQQAAQVCDPETPPAKVCKDVIEGLCCPIPVDDMTTPEVLAYLDALKAYQQANCSTDCPPDPCPVMAKASCASNTTMGTCVLLP